MSVAQYKCPVCGIGVLRCVDSRRSDDGDHPIESSRVQTWYCTNLDGLQFTLVAEAGKSHLPINYSALVPQWSGSSPVQIPGYKPFYLGIVEQVLPVGQVQGGAQRFAFIGFYDTPPLAFSEAQLRQMHAYLVTPVNKEDNKAQRLAAIMLGIDLNAGNVTEPTPYPWPVAAEADSDEIADEKE